MKTLKTLFTLLALPCASLLSLPSPGIQEMGAARANFNSNGNVSVTLGCFEKGTFKSELGLSYDIEQARAPLFALKCGFDEGLSDLIPVGLYAGLSQHRRTIDGKTSHHNVYSYIISKSLKPLTDAMGYVGYAQGESSMGAHRKAFYLGYTQKIVDKLNVDVSYTQKKSQFGGAKITAIYALSDSTKVSFGPSWSSSKKEGAWTMGHKKWIASVSINI